MAATKKSAKKQAEEVIEKAKKTSAQTGRKKTEPEEPKEEARKFFQPDYGSIVDQVDRKFRLTAGGMDKEARRSSFMSSGLLMTDLVLGGGILPGGWYTFFGAEQSAKSTHVMQLVGSALDTNVPLISYYDYEGSSDPNYIENMFHGRHKNIFGLQDEDGKWVITPRVRYYSSAVAEEFFDSVAALLRRLPDKQFVAGKWWYIYDNTKENRKIVGDNYSKKMFSEHNKFFVEAEDGHPQALIFVDSYPAMLPERLDEDETGSGMAAQARMFSENIPKVKGKLRKKAVTIIGVNQLRLRPATMYGNPEYEPGGESLKFNSDARIRQAGRAIPHGGGQIEEEQSVTVDGGADQYRYIHMKAIKNKLATPYLEGWQRIWITDGEGTARGFDPVWDTFQFLKNTGQCSGTMKKMNINLPGVELSKISWIDFKALILLTGADLKAHCKELGLSKPPRIRERCFEQIRNGKAMELYFEQLRGAAEDEEEEE